MRMAAKEIQQEIEKLYGKFTDQQDISIAEARRLIRGADFKKIDWQGMIRESMELREKIREGKGMLPEEVIEALEKQHKELEDRMAAVDKARADLLSGSLGRSRSSGSCWICMIKTSRTCMSTCTANMKTAITGRCITHSSMWGSGMIS